MNILQIFNNKTDRNKYRLQHHQPHHTHHSPEPLAGPPTRLAWPAHRETQTRQTPMSPQWLTPAEWYIKQGGTKKIKGWKKQMIFSFLIVNVKSHVQTQHQLLVLSLNVLISIWSSLRKGCLWCSHHLSCDLRFWLERRMVTLYGGWALGPQRSKAPLVNSSKQVLSPCPGILIDEQLRIYKLSVLQFCHNLLLIVMKSFNHDFTKALL